jgi:two-component system sensor histidine kinase UhpB
MTAIAGRSLRQRLLLRLLAVLGLSLLLASGLAYWRASDKVHTELEAALRVGAQLLDDAVKEVRRSPTPYQQLRIVIERFSGGRHLKVTLIDKEGQRVAASRLQEPDEPAPEWFYGVVRGEPHVLRVPLPNNISGYSTLLLEADPRNEVQEFWEEVRFGLLMWGIIASLAGALIYWGIGTELAPLDTLNGALSKVAAGEFQVRIGESGSRDLRAVSRGFNEMAHALEESRVMTARLEEQLSSVQEEERAELARDLHDEIGPLLFSVGIDAAEAKRLLVDGTAAEVTERLDVIRESVRISQKHVLRLLGRLRNGTVEDLGLEGAVAQLVEFWRVRQPHVDIQTAVPQDGIAPRIDTAIYRIVQESISNAVRHGTGTSQIRVAVDIDSLGTVHVVVEDDGGGLKSQRRGNGLTGMRERVTSLGGTLDVGDSPNSRGVRVTAHIPSGPAAHDSVSLPLNSAGMAL